MTMHPWKTCSLPSPRPEATTIELPAGSDVQGASMSEPIAKPSRIWWYVAIGFALFWVALPQCLPAAAS